MHSFLKGADWLQGQNRPSWEHGLHTLRLRWAAVLELYGGGQSHTVWSPTILRAIDSAFEHSAWAAFQEEMTNLRDAGRLTLCHNDFHGGNILWEHDDDGNSRGSVALVDWAEVRLRTMSSFIALT